MKKDLFGYDDYRQLMLRVAGLRDQARRGFVSRLSRSTKISATSLSYVLQGKRELTPEQALCIGSVLGLKRAELDFFLALVDRARAGTPALRDHLDRRIEALRKEADRIENRLPHERKLDERHKHIFYSMWYYSAIRNLTATPAGRSPERIATALKLPLPLVLEALEFLVAAGLCLRRNGGYAIGPRSLVIGKDDPLVHRMHIDWRQLAISRLQRCGITGDDELCITMPCSLSGPAQKKLRRLLLETVEKAGGIIDRAREEQVAFLCLDLFRLA